VSAVPVIPMSLGVPRVILGVAITHVLGDPSRGAEREWTLRLALVDEALRALVQDVAKPTLFRLGDSASGIVRKPVLHGSQPG
jgi:hypothetical protein